jgi:hypothetical protein
MSKGREQVGRIPEEARKAIQRTGLPLRSPFEGKKVNKIEDALKYLTKKLEGQGKIRGAYSGNDLRQDLPFGFTGGRPTWLRSRAPWDMLALR